MSTAGFAVPPLIFVITLATAAADSATPTVDDGYRLLFQQAHGSLPEADQRAVYASLNLKLSPDGQGLIFKDLECPPFEFNAADIMDLNGDGQDEVMLRGGNTCTSGGDGSSIWLLTKSAQGAWVTHLGFPAGGYRVLPEKHLGFPDLQFGGMGFCEGVWRWDGQTYQHFKDVATQAGGCDRLR